MEGPQAPFVSLIESRTVGHSVHPDLWCVGTEQAELTVALLPSPESTEECLLGNYLGKDHILPFLSQPQRGHRQLRGSAIVV